ncbi:MAG: hypothetical protein KC619_34300 [Myxococcales bacterium]|nr:hypothetical protein [Myxococcales bacterium]
MTSPDAEAEVLETLTRSARRTRLAFLVPGVAIGVLLLYPVFVLVTWMQLELLDVALVLASAGAAAGAMLGSILAGHRLGAAAWRARRAGLCRALADEHGLARADVEELADIVS